MSQLDYIKQILKQLKPELVKKYYVHTIGIFGLAVRDDFSAVSDVDIIVDFNQPVGIEFIDLADYIERHLQKKVDLVSRNGIKDKSFMSKRTPNLLVADILDSAHKILVYTKDLVLKIS